MKDPVQRKSPALATPPKKAADTIDYKLLAESTSDVIMRCGVDGVVKYVSPSVQQLMGIPPEELVGTSYRHLILPEDIPALMQTVKGYHAGRTVGYATYRMTRRDGSIVWVESNGSTIRDPATGGIDLVLVQRDITERKILEAKLSMLALTAVDGQQASERGADDAEPAGSTGPRTARRRTARSVN